MSNHGWGAVERKPSCGAGASCPRSFWSLPRQGRGRHIVPAELPTAGLLDELKASHALDNATFTVVGYGLVRVDKSTGPHAFLGFDGQRRYALQSLGSLQPYWLNLDANPSTDNGGSCFVDSGGPHFLGGVDSNLVVATTVDVAGWCRSHDKTYRIDTDSARQFLAQFVTLP